MKILVRITTKEAVERFDEILKEADGCIIARGYISA
jgi:pyruvate kinase